MATVDKDFKVKQGLNVTLGGTFGGTVTVATPTENAHATTKLYVDTVVGTPVVPTESSAPVAMPVTKSVVTNPDTRVHDLVPSF